jgi:hypothetical protein
VGEVKFTGQVLPSAKCVRYEIDVKRVLRGKLRMVIADGRTYVDDRLIYEAKACAWACSSRRRASDASRRRHRHRASSRPLGNDADTVASALRDSRSGLRACPSTCERGLRSQVAGVCDIDLDAAIDRKLKRFMGDAAAYAVRVDARRDRGRGPGR